MRRSILFLVLGLLMGAVVATTLAATTTADASNGDYLVMGTKNTARNSSKIISPNSTQFINTRNGRPAIKLEVKPGAPPMTVNSDERVTNLNADLLDGRSAANLKPISTNCSTPDATDGANYTCLAYIAVPGSGVLQMSGSIEITNNSDDTHDQVWCRLYVDDVLVDHSDRDMDVGFDFTNDQAVCSTHGSIVLHAGAHAVTFTLESVNADTDLGSAAMNAIWIPF